MLATLLGLRRLDGCHSGERLRGTALPEEPCQCPDCQRFYREHDRLIRESPTLRQQQELSWAALQAFRTLSGRVLDDLENINAHLFSIEALMERIFDVRVPDDIEQKF